MRVNIVNPLVISLIGSFARVYHECFFSLQIWKDRNMVWDPADYDGLNEIRLKVKQIWKPDIVLYTR